MDDAARVRERHGVADAIEQPQPIVRAAARAARASSRSPRTSIITVKTRPSGSCPTSWTGTMPGCSSAASVRASRRRRSASAVGRPRRHLDRDVALELAIASAKHDRPCRRVRSPRPRRSASPLKSGRSSSARSAIAASDPPSPLATRCRLHRSWRIDSEQVARLGAELVVAGADVAQQRRGRCRGRRGAPRRARW